MATQIRNARLIRNGASSRPGLVAHPRKRDCCVEWAPTWVTSATYSGRLRTPWAPPKHGSSRPALTSSGPGQPWTPQRPPPKLFPTCRDHQGPDLFLFFPGHPANSETRVQFRFQPLHPQVQIVHSSQYLGPQAQGLWKNTRHVTFLQFARNRSSIERGMGQRSTAP